MTHGGDTYSTTTCPTCGAQVDGIHNRYACPLCDWISPPEEQRQKPSDGE